MKRQLKVPAAAQTPGHCKQKLSSAWAGDRVQAKALAKHML